MVDELGWNIGLEVNKQALKCKVRLIKKKQRIEHIWVFADLDGMALLDLMGA